MFWLSLVRYRSFSVQVNFRSIISGLSSGRILVRVIRVGSLLLGLVASSTDVVGFVFKFLAHK